MPALAAKRLGLTGLFVLQGLCATFLGFEMLADLAGWESRTSLRENDMFEYAVVTALLVSLVFTGREIFRLAARNTRIERQLQAASGAFQELLAEHFDEWDLTTSERDVALLAIKGLSINDIAGVRNTRDGTVKAQLNAIYRKAGVTGRPQLISLFIEELMGRTPQPEGAPAE